jgi:hypothetical protein
VLLEYGGLAGAEIEMCEALLGDDTLFVDRFESVRDLYERREREANFNGNGWEGGGL